MISYDVIYDNALYLYMQQVIFNDNILTDIKFDQFMFYMITNCK